MAWRQLRATVRDSRSTPLQLLGVLRFFSARCFACPATHVRKAGCLILGLGFGV